MGAKGQAILTGDTSCRVKENLRYELLGLRIGAPLASKRTTLQKYKSPNSGAVMDGKPLNIKYSTFVTQKKLLNLQI